MRIVRFIESYLRELPQPDWRPQWGLLVDHLVHPLEGAPYSTHRLDEAQAPKARYVTRFMTLEPGDLVLSGTPAGVGPIQPGDTMTVEIEGLGALSNPVVAEQIEALAR
jgi:hypothetical protein